jgi:bacterial leucyl aminopeptidase
MSPHSVLSSPSSSADRLVQQGIKFFDITYTQDLGQTARAHGVKTVKFPSKTAHNASIAPLLKKLEKKNMRSHLEKFTSFHTRYYKSQYGVESSAWLLEQVNKTLADAGALAHGAHATPFPHSWGQASIIATIPGKSEKTIVIGAHQDSINLFLPSILSAPGADDDGSGTVTILEALRVLLTSDEVVKGKAENTIEFHWYSAEEGGLLGSQAIFQTYQKTKRDVKAMLQQDMVRMRTHERAFSEHTLTRRFLQTGYVQKTLDAGEPESIGVITDYVDPGLTEFIKLIITDYCDIPYVLTQCGYACSDHASASKVGIPASFAIESDFKYSDSKIHTSDDTIKYLSFDHMLQHAKMTLALAYELAFTKFD